MTTLTWAKQQSKSGLVILAYVAFIALGVPAEAHSLFKTGLQPIARKENAMALIQWINSLIERKNVGS